MEKLADLYDILGIEKTVAQEEIKARYRELAKQWHPDRNQGNKEAEVKFKKISEAYEILGDPQKRAAYDHEGNTMERAARLVDAAEQLFGAVGTVLREFGFGRRRG